MEKILHYVWKHRLHIPEDLVTTDNIPVTVIDSGTENTDSGPDFFNAKVKIGETVWVGNVEIHDKASDWKKHKHDKDKAYDSVILHLVGVDDAIIKRSNGDIIIQAVLKAPERVQRNIEWLSSRDSSLPCILCIPEIDPLSITGWMNSLLSERIDRKVKDINMLLEKYGNDWNEVFYILFTRSFGFGINSDVFEALAISLPYRYILKQRSNHSQIEAMMFGQAGMLDEKIDSYYYQLLQQEYSFLRKKFNLQPLDLSLFKNMRTRPANLPHIKIAQLAAIWMKYDTLFSRVLEEKDTSAIKKLFSVPASYYWDKHFHFSDKRQAEAKKVMGDNGLNILLINAVVPLLFAYGEKNGQTEYVDRATALLESLPPESNRIVSTFSEAGIRVRHAGDSQALVQLKREYCDKNKCLYCCIGFDLLKHSGRQSV